ncbi:tyrosine-type recombinase/integrase [Mesorhizobium sp. M0085]|uniref:tyrosine-type recombinase/integrase n=1 Tax=Mesorhizobium sp. M0085 TaxID=2956872 RepID=UPI00333784E1
MLTIRGTKFGRPRLVPMHASTCAVLQDYLKRRRHHCATQAASPYLFTSQLGNRLDVEDIHPTLYTLSRQIGLRGATDSHGPRLHDMRHVFATTRWCVGTKPIKIPSGSCSFPRWSPKTD